MQARTTQKGPIHHQAPRFSAKCAEWRRRRNNFSPETLSLQAAGRRSAGFEKHAAETSPPQDSKTRPTRVASCYQDQAMNAGRDWRRRRQQQEAAQTNSISRTHQEHRPIGEEKANERRAFNYLRCRPPSGHRAAAARMLTTSAAFLIAALIVTCYALASEQPQARTHSAQKFSRLSGGGDVKSGHLSSSEGAIEAREAAAALNSKSPEHEEARPSRLDEVVVSRSNLQGVSQRSKRASQSRTSAAVGGQKQAALGQNQRQREDWPQQPPMPPSVGRAAGANVKNVTAQNGQTVMLHCFVEPSEMGETTPISWMSYSSGELQMISLDTTVILSDQRFVIRHGLARENDWALQVSALNKSDAGLYQCQTGDENATLIQAYQLNIVEPQATILGSPDLAVRVGAPINLTCVISHSPDQLQFVFWYRDDRMINYDFEREKRGKIVLSKLSARPDTIASNLQVFRSTPDDSANYTCAPSGAKSTSIHVHVLQAEDKRLIMFQNDDNLQRELFAASPQHQSNSALSNQPARLSRARAYALLAALLILAAWFQLVAQAQTCISLCLLAIIGLLLGQTTNCAHSSRALEQQRRRRRRQSQDSKSTADDNDELKFRRLSADDKLASCSSPEHDENEDEEGDQPAPAECLEADPLLSGAHSALHLLRTLTRNSDSTCSLNSAPSSELGEGRREQPVSPTASGCDETSKSELREQADGRKKRRQRRHAAVESATAQTSPSGVSSASTGYNSDGARPLPPASVNLVPHRQLQAPLESAGEDEQLEMIELLRNQPSAMRLIMEQLRAAKINQPAAATKGGLRPLGKQLIYSGSASSFVGRSSGQSKNNNNNNSGAANSLERATSSCLNNGRHFFAANDFCQFGAGGLKSSSSTAAGSGEEEPIYSIPASRVASGAPSVSGDESCNGGATAATTTNEQHSLGP